MAQEMSTTPIFAIDEVWTAEDVRNYLKLDNVGQIKELTRKRSKHPIPSRKVGKMLRFAKSEIVAWFNGLEGSAPISPSTRTKLSRAMRRRLDEAA
jgi:hypothetical protein